MTDDDDIYCTQEVMEHRLDKCKSCQFFKFNSENFTFCEKTGCLINLMIIMNFKSCPEGNW